MANHIENSPVTIGDARIAEERPETPARAFRSLGNTGHLFVSGDHTYGLAETDDGDFVFCWFDDAEVRRDSGVRTKVIHQLPEVNAAGQALVLGGDGDEVYVVDLAGNATCLGVAVDTVFKRATWLSTGFAVTTFDNELHVYAWTDEIAPVGSGRFTDYAFDDIRAIEGDVVIACGEGVQLFSLGLDVRELAHIDQPLLHTADCINDSGRAMWILPGPHLVDGDLFQLEHIGAALERRDEFPELQRAGNASELADGDDIAAPSEQVESPALHIRAPEQSPYWIHTNALLMAMKESGTLRDQPLQGVLDCLTMPMEEDLYAYIYFRAHYDVGTVPKHEGWLVGEPKLAGNTIELGSISNGNPIQARDRLLFEYSHDEEREREFPSFESWLIDVVHRAEKSGDPDPFLRAR